MRVNEVDQFQFNQQVADANRRFAAQQDYSNKVLQHQLANPQLTNNPAMATNALLAKKRGFANVGAWYQDIMDRLGNSDPKIYEPAQRELDQYEANIKKDQQHTTTGKMNAWRNQAQQQARKPYNKFKNTAFDNIEEEEVRSGALSPFSEEEELDEIGHAGAACTTGNPPLEEAPEFLSRLKTLSGIMAK